MIDLRICGHSLWAPGVDGRPADAKVDLGLLPVRIRRRTSALTRMAVSVFAEATATSGSDRSNIAIVFGSVYGEIETTYELLRQLAEGPGAALSPTKFHNSVHNTAPGYLSIACQNREINTAITAGWSTVAMAVIEAAGLLYNHKNITEVAVVVAEEALPEQLARCGASYASLAAAFVVARAQVGQPAWQLVHRPPDARYEQPIVDGAYRHNPCSPAIALAQACRGEWPEVVLGPADGPTWMLIQV